MSGWALIAGLGLATYLFRAAGPLSAGRLHLVGWVERPLPYVMPSVLAALVVTATFAVGDRLTIDERAIGLAVAGLGLVARAPTLAVVVAAAAATALARALG